MEENDLPLVIEDYFASGAASEDNEVIGECDPDELAFWYEAWLEGWDVPDAILQKLELLAEVECELQAERELYYDTNSNRSMGT